MSLFSDCWQYFLIYVIKIIYFSDKKRNPKIFHTNMSTKLNKNYQPDFIQWSDLCSRNVCRWNVSFAYLNITNNCTVNQLRRVRCCLVVTCSSCSPVVSCIKILVHVLCTVSGYGLGVLIPHTACRHHDCVDVFTPYLETRSLTERSQRSLTAFTHEISCVFRVRSIRKADSASRSDATR